MTVAEVLRDAHARAIAENSTDIAVHRVTYVDDGAGGRIKQSTDLPPFQGRLVPARNQQASVNEAGMLRVAGWLLLAPWDSDLQVDDTFSVDGRSFRVVRVVHRARSGIVYAVQAEVEEVG